MPATNKIAIFHFSGTGNTERVAFAYADALRSLGKKVTVGRIEQYTHYGFPPELEGCEAVGIGFPVHCFDAPEIIGDFLKLLPHREGTPLPCFLFKTQADPLGGGGTTRKIRSALAGKGYHVFHEGMLLMPSNWFRKYPKSISQIEWRIARRRIEVFASEIAAGSMRKGNDSLWSRLLTALSPLEKLRTKCFSGLFHFDEQDCARCGVCVECCPVQNIVMPHSKPQSLWHCQSCMRCFYKCPHGAVKWRFFGFFILKKGYDVHVELNEPYETVETHSYRSLIAKLPRRLRAYAEEIPETE